MARTAVVSALLLASSVASAAEYRSEEQQVRFQGLERVIDTTYTLPFGTELDLWIAEFWIGVTITLRGNSEFALTVTGLSDLWWDTEDGNDGLLFQQIRPLPGSGVAGMKSNVNFEITFDVWDGGYGTGTPFLKFPLFTNGINFRLDGTNIEPFMLPGQVPEQARIETVSRDLAFNLPLVLPLSLGGVVTLNIGTNLRGYPRSFANFYGLALETLWPEGGTEISYGADLPGELYLFEPMPSVELESSYEAFVLASIEYIFEADLFFEIDIIGFFQFPITIPIFDFAVPLFASDRDIGFATEVYSHPLPQVGVQALQHDFGEIEVGSDGEFVLSVTSDGNLDIEGLVGIEEGQDAFAATPNSLALIPGGVQGVNITFAPPDVGPFQGTLVVATNDPVQPYLEVRLTGTGVVPDPANDENGVDNGNIDQDFGDDFIFTTCGCANGGVGGGWLPVALLPLLAVRRRRT